MKGNFGAIFLILIGAIALAHNLGYVEINVGQLLLTWWPLLLVALGVGFFFTPGTERRNKDGP